MFIFIFKYIRQNRTMWHSSTKAGEKQGGKHKIKLVGEQGSTCHHIQGHEKRWQASKKGEKELNF